MHRSAMRSSSFFASWTVYAFLMAMGDSCMGHEFVQRPQRMHAVVAGCSMASFAEHEHAVVLADDRVVHIDLGVAHHGSSQHHLVRLLRQPGEFHDVAQARADDDVRVARASDGVA